MVSRDWGREWPRSRHDPVVTDVGPGALDLGQMELGGKGGRGTKRPTDHQKTPIDMNPPE